jgi:hypothetical protein
MDTAVSEVATVIKRIHFSHRSKVGPLLILSQFPTSLLLGRRRVRRYRLLRFPTGLRGYVYPAPGGSAEQRAQRNGPRPRHGEQGKAAGKVRPMR